MSFPQSIRTDSTSDAPAHRGERTVMIVEDDEAYRYALARTVASLGHRVVEMQSGLDALKWFDDGGRIDALISDLRLPAGTPNGVSVALMVHRRQPHAVIFLHSAFEGLADSIDDDLGRLMPKSAGMAPMIDALQGAFA